MNITINLHRLLLPLIGAMVAICMCGCRTARVVERTEIEKPVVMERTHRDSMVATKILLQRDTIWQHDSVVVRADGTDRWHTRYVTKWKEQHDTITIVRVDSVPRPVMVTQKVTREVDEPPNIMSRIFDWVKGMLLGMLITIGLIVYALYFRR